MPRRLYPKPCSCNCGGTTKGGEWLPGHDQKLRAAIEGKAGGLVSLKKLVEKTLRCRIKVREG
ncbi:MAG: hypothetical protein JRJ51_23815 [Deltaproteobacteria bacterium]|jgi:hypothetical protein|nr:hypothetical protein [Deltaproteobacteria bacterium]